jgi:diguanylate cyclase (GGDEF)-like protein
MTEFQQMALDARSEHAARLTQTLGLVPQAWGLVALTLLERSHTLLTLKDTASGRYVYASAGMQALVGHDLVGLTDSDWVSGEDCAALRLADQSAMVQTVPQVSEHRFDLKPGPDAPQATVKQDFSVTRLLLPMVDGRAAPYLCSLWGDLHAQHQLQTQHQLALQQLEALQQAVHAQRQENHQRAGSGFYAYGHFEDQLRRELDLSSREHREFALVSVALDALSPHAAQLGGEARGRVLEALGRLLRSNTRAMDSSCRTEEGQFVVLLSGVGLATAHSRMEGLRRQCATQIVMLDGQDLGFSVSMGVASFPHTARSQDELLSAAHAALAEAQRRGGNHVALASIRFEPRH